MNSFKHGQKVVVCLSENSHATGKVFKLSENEELVRLSSGEFKVFHNSKVATPDDHAKYQAHKRRFKL